MHDWWLSYIRPAEAQMGPRCRSGADSRYARSAERYGSWRVQRTSQVLPHLCMCRKAPSGGVFEVPTPTWAGYLGGLFDNRLIK